MCHTVVSPALTSGAWCRSSSLAGHEPFRRTDRDRSSPPVVPFDFPDGSGGYATHLPLPSRAAVCREPSHRCKPLSAWQPLLVYLAPTIMTHIYILYYTLNARSFTEKCRHQFHRNWLLTNAFCASIKTICLLSFWQCLSTTVWRND